VKFSTQELIALIETGVFNFNFHTIPLWYWIAKSSRLKPTGLEWIKLLTFYGEPHETANAIRIIQVIGQGTPELADHFDRDRALRKWLSFENDEPLNVALDFLRTNGASADLEVLLKLSNSIDENRRNKIAPCLISLALNIDLHRAFDILNQFDPITVPVEIAVSLFSNVDSISNEILQACLNLKADSMRRAAAVALNSRQSMQEADAQRLMTDSDPETRLIAVETLLRRGVQLPESVIRAALVQRRSGLGALGGGGYEDTEYYDRYRRQRLSAASFDELKKLVESSGPLDDIEITELYIRFTQDILTEIRKNLGDGFKDYFSKKLEKLASEVGDDSKPLSDIGRLENYARKNLTTKTLDIICKYKSGSDLDLIRKTIDLKVVNISYEALTYLERFGDWSDRDRIMSFTTMGEGSGSFLSWNYQLRSERIARSLYAIGREYLTELLDGSIEASIRAAIVRKTTLKDFRKFDDDRILRLLSDQNEKVRQYTALKCLQASSKARVKRLINRYCAGDEQRYYNSIHWLDLGTSMSRSVVEKATKFELEDRT